MFEDDVTRPDRERARRTIDDLDLDVVLGEATRVCGWSPDEAREAERWYRRHLWICYLHGDDLSIPVVSKYADQLWHQHILNTTQYLSDCQAIFGRFLHHRPLYGRPSADDARAFARVVAFYVEEFEMVPVDPAFVSGSDPAGV